MFCCEKTQKLKPGQNLKTQTVTKLKTVAKFKDFYGEKSKTLKSPKKKSQGLTKLKKNKVLKNKFLTKSLWKILTPWYEWEVIGAAFCNNEMFPNSFEHPSPFSRGWL